MSPAVASGSGSRWLRWRFNLFPAYRGTGARVTHVARDWREVRVQLPLNWRTRNYVGTIYGGSLYAAVDPFYMLMLIFNLGPEYVVWDKAAKIVFKKPGRATLYAGFRLDAAELEEIRKRTQGGQPVDRVYRVELADRAGTVHAVVEKTVYVRRRRPGEASAVRGPATPPA